MCVCVCVCAKRHHIFSVTHFIVICGLSGSAKFLHIISWTAQFSVKILFNTECVFIFSTTFVYDTSYSKNNSTTYNHKRTQLILCHFSCYFLIQPEFYIHILDKPSISNFTNICLVGSELFHEDGRTDMTLLEVTFRSIRNSPNNTIHPCTRHRRTDHGEGLHINPSWWSGI